MCCVHDSYILVGDLECKISCIFVNTHFLILSWTPWKMSIPESISMFILHSDATSHYLDTVTS